MGSAAGSRSLPTSSSLARRGASGLLGYAGASSMQTGRQIIRRVIAESSSIPHRRDRSLRLADPPFPRQPRPNGAAALSLAARRADGKGVKSGAGVGLGPQPDAARPGERAVADVQQFFAVEEALDAIAD